MLHKAPSIHLPTLTSPRTQGLLYVHCQKMRHYMDVSENSGTPKSSISIGFSIVNHPFWDTPIFGNTHMVTRIMMNNVNINTMGQWCGLEITTNYRSRGTDLIKPFHKPVESRNLGSYLLFIVFFCGSMYEYIRSYRYIIVYLHVSDCIYPLTLYLDCLA